MSLVKFMEEKRMKKTLSIFLIITMLLSMVIAAVPVSATGTGASAVTKPTYDTSKLGNYMATTAPSTNANRKIALDALIAETGKNYIPVVVSDGQKTNVKNLGYETVLRYDEITSGTDANNLKYYYIWESFDWGSANTGTLANVVIDGGGHTLTMGGNCPYFYAKTENITLKNLTITKSATVSISNSNHNIFGRNGSTGYTKVENVTLDVDYNVVASIYTGKSMGVLVPDAGAGSEINNVLCTTNITVNIPTTNTDNQYVEQISGLVGATGEGVTVKNVVTRGAIAIAQTGSNGLRFNDRVVGGISLGGIVGEASGSTTFENCFNEMSITVKNGSNLGSGVSVGGIVGKAASETTFKNCVSSGSITIGEAADTAFTPNISNLGGIVGYVNGKATFENCYNEKSITVNSDAVLESGLHMGGIVGNTAGGAAVTNCENNVRLTVALGTTVTGMGNIVGKENNDTFTGCVNKTINPKDIDASFVNLKAALEKASPYLADSDKYVEESFDNLKNAYDASIAILNAGIYCAVENGEAVFTNKNDIDAQTEAIDNAIEALELIKPAIDDTKLTEAIQKAEALVESEYTADSWNALAQALAAAKALDADTQAEVDAAVDAVNLAIAGLDRKPAEAAPSVDVTKLAEAIAKAEALKVNEYTNASWTALQVALSNAKQAKLATAQADVDAAIAALNGAMDNLVKAPVESDTPAADNKDDNATDNSGATEKEGCGSVIGGAAVILTAVLALGAGVSFKKKED